MPPLLLLMPRYSTALRPLLATPLNPYWNPIEHRLFSQISTTWAGTPLTSFELALDGIRRTTTTTGLTVQATLIDTVYEKGLTVSDEEMASLAIEAHTTCPQWNYTIYPRTSRSCF